MLLALLILASLVVIPFLFWRGTWFGRPLPDTELDTYLSDESKPRHVQHALAQISPRIERGDPSVKRWYPRIAELGRRHVTELRVTAAWVMGQDNRSDEFHQALLGMLADAEPAVRRNTALSLSRFGDAAARPELRAMLRPYSLRAAREGTLRYRLKLRDVVNPGTLVARLETGAGEPVEVRSPLPGKLEAKIAADGARVNQNDEIALLSPSADHVWEALRALYLVGTREDLADVEKFKNPPADWDVKIAQQAQLTARQIRTKN